MADLMPTINGLSTCTRVSWARAVLAKYGHACVHCLHCTNSGHWFSQFYAEICSFWHSLTIWSPKQLLFEWPIRLTNQLIRLSFQQQPSTMQCQAATSITSEKNFEIITIQNPTLPSGCCEGVCVGCRGNQLSWLHNEENRYARARQLTPIVIFIWAVARGGMHTN